MKRSTFKQVFRQRLLHTLLGGLSAAALAVGLAVPTWAGPRGEQVVSGSANFTRDGNRTVIEAAHNTIINYDSFDIGRHQSVQFIQPDEAARVLNRILGGGRTSIEGSLLANGHVYFVNPAGIFLGGEALVNVGALTAAAGSISNADFLSGLDRFTDLSGSVINAGHLQAASGVHLLGHQVVNLGSIVTGPGGVVTLAAGNQVLLAQAGTGVLVDVKGGEDLDGAAVRNVGLIETGFGQVSMSASDPYSLAVEHSGTIRAADVQLTGLDGQVSITGWVDASNEAGAGGEIQVVGRELVLAGATLDASGRDGGGSIYVGGDIGGQGTMPTATYTLVDEHSVLDARATGFGDGGRVVVWADQGTAYYGSLSVAGGLLGGNGGFAEVSGAFLDARGSYDLSAVAGQAGTLLFDPIDVVIRGGVGSGNTGGGTGGMDPQQINWSEFVTASPFVIYESELEGVTSGTIIVEASRSIVTQGTFGGNAVVLGEDVNLILRTTNQNPGTDGSFQGIDLTAHGESNLTFRTRGLGSIEIHAGSSGVAGPGVDPVDVRISSLEADQSSIRILNEAGAVYIRDQVRAPGQAGGDINLESATDTILAPGALLWAQDELNMAVGSPEIQRQVLSDGTVLGEGMLDFTGAQIHARSGQIIAEGDITIGQVTGHYFGITSKRGRILDGILPGEEDGVDILLTGWVDLSAGIAIGEFSDGNDTTYPGTNGNPLTAGVDVDWDFISTQGNALEVHVGGWLTNQDLIDLMPQTTYFGSAQIVWREDTGHPETAKAIPADTAIHIAFVNEDNTGYLDLSRGFEYELVESFTVALTNSALMARLYDLLGDVYGQEALTLLGGGVDLSNPLNPQIIPPDFVDGDMVTIYARKPTESGFFSVDLTQVDGGRALLRAGNIDASRSYDMMYGTLQPVDRYNPDNRSTQLRIDPQTGNPYVAVPLPNAIYNNSFTSYSGEFSYVQPMVAFGTVNYNMASRFPGVSGYGYSGDYVINTNLEIGAAGWIRGDLTFDYLMVSQNGLVNNESYVRNFRYLDWPDNNLPFSAQDPSLTYTYYPWWAADSVQYPLRRADSQAIFSIDGNDSIGLIAAETLVIPNLGDTRTNYNAPQALGAWVDYDGNSQQAVFQDLILHAEKDILQRQAFYDTYVPPIENSFALAPSLGIFGGSSATDLRVKFQQNASFGDILTGNNWVGDSNQIGNQNQQFGNFALGTEIQARHLSFRTGNNPVPIHTESNPTVPAEADGRVVLHTNVTSLDLELYGSRDIGGFEVVEHDGLLVTRLVTPDGGPDNNKSGRSIITLRNSGDLTVLTANTGGFLNLTAIGDITLWWADVEALSLRTTEGAVGSGSVKIGNLRIRSDGAGLGSSIVDAEGDVDIVSLLVNEDSLSSSDSIQIFARGNSVAVGDMSIDQLRFNSYNRRSSIDLTANGSLLLGEINAQGLLGLSGASLPAVSDLFFGNATTISLEATHGDITHRTDAQIQASFAQLAADYNALMDFLPSDHAVVNASIQTPPDLRVQADALLAEVPEIFEQRVIGDIVDKLVAGGSIDVRTQIALLDNFEFTDNTRIDEFDSLYIQSVTGNGTGDFFLKVGGDLWVETITSSGDILLAGQHGGDIVFMGVPAGMSHISTTGDVTLLANGKVSGPVRPDGTAQLPPGVIEAGNLTVIAQREVILRTDVSGLAIHTEGNRGVSVTNQGGSALSLAPRMIPIGDAFVGSEADIETLYPGLGAAFTGSLGGITRSGGDLTLSAGSITGAGIGQTDPEQRGDVTLIATHGDVILSDTVLAEALVIQAASGQVSLVTDVHSLDITAGGNVAVTEADGLALQVDTTGNVTVTVNEGDLLLGLVDAGTGNVNLAATAGSILDDNGSAVNIIANRVDLAAAQAIGTIEDLRQFTGDAIETQVAAIGDVVTTAEGSTINLANSGGGPLNFVGQVRPGDGVAGALLMASDTNLDAQGLFGPSSNVVLDAGDSVGFASGGVLTVDNVINLGANSGTTLLLWGTDDVVGASGRTLQLEAAHIQFASGSAGGDTTLMVSGQDLAAELTGAGNLTVAATGDLSVRAVTLDGDLNLTSSGGRLTLEEVTAGSQRDITLVASGGVGGSGTVQGRNLSVTAADDVSLQTQVERLDAQITGAGITIREVDDLAIGQVTADGNVQIAAGGDLRAINQDGVADVIGQRVNLAAAGSVAGATDAQSLEVTAHDRLDASGDQRVQVQMLGGSGRVGRVQASLAGGQVNLSADGDLLGLADDNIADITAAHIALVAAGRIGGPNPGSALDVLVPASFSADTSSAPGGADRSVTIDFLAGRPGQVTVTGGGEFTDSVLVSDLTTALPVVANEPVLDVPLFYGESEDQLAGGGTMTETTRALGRREQVGGVPVATFVAAIDQTAMGYQQYVVAIRFEQFRFSAPSFVRFLQHGFAGENRSQVAARNLTLAGLQDLNRDLQVQGLLAAGRMSERYAAIRPFVPEGWSVEQLDAVLAEIRSARGLGAMASLR